jgi:hypothetical protein
MEEIKGDGSRSEGMEGDQRRCQEAKGTEGDERNGMR